MRCIVNVFADISKHIVLTRLSLHAVYAAMSLVSF